MASPPRLPRDRVRVFWRARLEGLTYEEAVARAGVSPNAGRRWVAETGGMIPGDLGGGSGRYLSLAEREEIAAGWAAGLSKAEIARGLGRHRCSVGRELALNRTVRYPARERRGDGQRHKPGPKPGAGPPAQHERLRYRASVAQAKAEARARRPGSRKLASCPALLAAVKAGLAKRWSPEQISRVLRRDFPDQPEMRVSHETIYQELYVQGRGELRRELTRCLRTGRALRRPRRLPDHRTSRRIPDKVMISERPPEANDRAVPGHWEGDLILGKNNGSAVGTLVERSTRFVMLLHLPGDHGAEAVRDAMITATHALPLALRRSLTWDQGIEMARHTEITLATELPIYFCDPVRHEAPHCIPG